MELAPRTVQNMPDCFRREPMTDHARADKQVLTAELRVSHTFGISLKVVCLSADLIQNIGIG